MRGTVRTLLGGVVLSSAILITHAARAEEIVWWAPNWGAARADTLVQQFQAANPDITVRIEQTVADGLQNWVQVALRSGSPPDLIDINDSWNIPYAATGLLEPLDDYLTKSKLDLAPILPVALAISKWNGKLYGLPYRTETHALIYNKDLFRQAGLDPDKPPQTWTELRDDAKKLTRTGPAGQQQYGYGVDGGGEVANLVTRFLTVLWSNGGEVLSADGKTAQINQPKSVEAVAFYTGLYTTDGVSPPSTLQNDGLALRRLFENGVIAMYQTGQYDLPVLRQEAPNVHFGVGLLPHPEGGQPVGMLGGWNFIVPKASKHHDATWKFLMFLMQPAQMGMYTDTFPARSDAMGLPRFQDPDLQVYKAMLAYIRPQPAVPAWVRISQILYDSMQSVLLKSATPQSGMDSANKLIQAALDR